MSQKAGLLGTLAATVGDSGAAYTAHWAQKGPPGANLPVPTREDKLRTLLISGLALALMGSTAAVAADKVQIGDTGIFPESLTSTADGTLIVGSIGTGQIYKAAPGATTADSCIAAVTDGPTAVLGVYADEANKTLRASYSDLAMFAGAGGKASMLRSYDLT